MPRYFLHQIRQQGEIRDQEGIVLSDRAAALALARRGAAEILCEEIHQGRPELEQRIEVRDEDGALVGIVRFAELLAPGSRIV